MNLPDRILLALAPLLTAASSALGDAPRITSAELLPRGSDWSVRVMLQHPDSGWDHYASGWEVLAPDGTVLAEAEITHPHSADPFQTDLDGIQVPAGVDHLLIRVRCTLDGWSARTYRLDLPRPQLTAQP
jgi:hypothetical protein